MRQFPRIRGAHGLAGGLIWSFALTLFLVGVGLAPPAFSKPQDYAPASLLMAEETSEMPPAWRMEKSHRMPAAGEATSDNESPSRYRRQGTRGYRPWYQPRAALGIGANLPDIFPIEGYLFFGRYFGLRAFYTPSLPFKIRVEMPSDVISTKKDVAIANPDFTIHLKANYGPHYGIESMVFPFGGSFFLSLGVSYRRFRLTGDTHSPILICSLVEVEKDPDHPCADPNASLKTRTELSIRADATTSALLTRGAFGGFWHVGSIGYFMLEAGLAKPTRIRRSISVKADVQEDGTDEDVSGALAQVKSERESDLKDKALKEMRPYEEKALPIVGLGAGVRF